ncbi:peptidase [Photorhabdus luminescens]|uniref:C39 family peptidase n=1 Tax=Photorhabdus akhurstii TaxID=171438 RepID=UPI000CF9CAA7|nr:peptidase [Photorhabdus luminescens]PQQ27540.1 peptidase [Photorhabdus luminescens]
MSNANFIIFLSLIFFSCYINAAYTNDRFGEGEKQHYDNTCGISSFIHVMKDYNIVKSELELIKEVGIKPEYSFLDLSNLAKKFNIKTIGVKISKKQLMKIKSPAILYINRLGKDHFVVLKGINNEWVQLYDPAWGTLNYTIPQFTRYWLQDDNFGRALIFLKKTNINVDDDKIYKKFISIW